MRRSMLVLAVVLALGACDAPGSSPPEGRASDQAPPETPTVRTTTPADVPEAERAPIEVTQPTDGERVSSPFVLAGTANVFEATVSYWLVDGAGEKIAEGFTTASCGTGCRGDYKEQVKFEVDEPTVAILEVFESSAEDGTPMHVVRVPLTLLP